MEYNTAIKMATHSAQSNKRSWPTQHLNKSYKLIKKHSSNQLTHKPIEACFGEQGEIPQLEQLALSRIQRKRKKEKKKLNGRKPS